MNLTSVRQLSLFGILLFAWIVPVGAQTLFVPGGAVGTSANGNVGIGTTNPEAKFEVVGGEVRLPGGATTGGYTHFNFGDGKNYLRGTTIIADTGGNVGIGTSSPSHKLAVNGTIKTKEVIVESTGWADDVFMPGYALPTIQEVAAHIGDKGYLPGVPSAAQVAGHGVAVGEMQATLLRKIEELTLYVIAQQKQLATAQAQIERQGEQIKALSTELASTAR